MKRVASILSFSLIVTLCLGACSQRISSFSIVTTESVDLSNQCRKVASGVMAKSSATFVLLYFGGEDASYYKAIGACIAEHDGDLMTNVEVTRTSVWFLIGVYADYKVTGDVWKFVDGDRAQAAEDEEVYEFSMVDGEPYLTSPDGSQRLKAVRPRT